MLHERPAGRQSLRMACLSLQSMSMSSGMSTVPQKPNGFTYKSTKPVVTSGHPACSESRRSRHAALPQREALAAVRRHRLWCTTALNPHRPNEGLRQNVAWRLESPVWCTPGGSSHAQGQPGSRDLVRGALSKLI